MGGAIPGDVDGLVPCTKTIRPTIDRSTNVT
jgi:hypothetical protein